MRALHVIETLGRGGAESALAAGLPALQAPDVNVALFVLRKPYDLRGEIERSGIFVETGSPPGILGLVRLCAQWKPDVIHAHLYMPGLAARLIGKALRIPVFITLHSRGYDVTGGGRLGWRKLVDRGTVGWTRPVFLAVSEAAAEDLENDLHLKARVVPNPVDPLWSSASPEREAARRTLGISKHEWIALGAGRLHPEKGFDVLAQAAEFVPQAIVVIAGKGKEDEKLARYPIRLLGLLPPDELKQWTGAADVVVVPSRSEAFGLFAAQALASGTPVIASNIAGLREVVKDAGLLVPPGDPRALANAMLGLMADPALRSSLSLRGPLRVEHFTTQAWAKSLKFVYEESLAGKDT